VTNFNNKVVYQIPKDGDKIKKGTMSFCTDYFGSSTLLVCHKTNCEQK